MCLLDRTAIHIAAIHGCVRAPLVLDCWSTFSMSTGWQATAITASCGMVMRRMCVQLQQRRRRWLQSAAMAVPQLCCRRRLLTRSGGLQQPRSRMHDSALSAWALSR